MSPAARRRPSRNITPRQPTRSGRQPSAEGVSVRLIDPAVADLQHLSRTNPNATRWALKKLIHLTRDPEAGEPLHGDLIGWRKLVVGNRDWRVVWRVTFDDSGTPIVDVAEVWAVGARSDDDVYNEMRSRVDTLPKVPSTMALNEIVSRLGKVAGHLGLEDDEPAREVTPNWLRDKLVKTAGIPATQVDQMALEEAITTWENFISHPR